MPARIQSRNILPILPEQVSILSNIQLTPEHSSIISSVNGRRQLQQALADYSSRLPPQSLTGDWLLTLAHGYPLTASDAETALRLVRLSQACGLTAMRDLYNNVKWKLHQSLGGTHNNLYVDYERCERYSIWSHVAALYAYQVHSSVFTLRVGTTVVQRSLEINGITELMLIKSMEVYAAPPNMEYVRHLLGDDGQHKDLWSRPSMVTAKNTFASSEKQTLDPWYEEDLPF